MSLRSVPAIAAGAALASTLLPAPATAAGATTYVDCSALSDGDGSIASPLNSLSSVNALTLGAGDSVLFTRGSTCRGQLKPKGSGSGGAPILISAYGDAADRVAIDADGATQAVLLRNSAHLTLDHLDLTAPGDGRTLRRGVYVVADDGGLLPEVTAGTRHPRRQGLHARDAQPVRLQ